MNLGIDYQRPLTSQKGTTRCASYCSTIYGVFLPNNQTDSDQASRSNYQLRNKKDKIICHITVTQSETTKLWKLCWTNDPVSSTNRLQVGEKRDRQTGRQADERGTHRLNLTLETYKLMVIYGPYLGPS